MFSVYSKPINFTIVVIFDCKTKAIYKMVLLTFYKRSVVAIADQIVIVVVLGVEKLCQSFRGY